MFELPRLATLAIWRITSS